MRRITSVVFSTKERRKLIKQHEQSKLWAYMAGVARNHDFLVLGAVETYIQNQAIHHKKITFEQEFVALREKHGISFDPKYVFG